MSLLNMWPCIRVATWSLGRAENSRANEVNYKSVVRVKNEGTSRQGLTTDLSKLDI